MHCECSQYNSHFKFSDNVKKESLKHLSLANTHNSPELDSCISKIFNSVSPVELVPYLPLIVYNSMATHQENSNKQLVQPWLSSSQSFLSNLLDKLNSSSESMNESTYVEFSKVYVKVICALQKKSAFITW